MTDEDEQRMQAVAVIVGEEMVCPDDHWNDEMRTRPDSEWTSEYHKEGSIIEFSGRPYEKDREAWIRAYIEAEDQVIELWRSGHRKARAILDLHSEIAYTCDTCGLWSHVEHIDPKDSFSVEDRSGALFDVRDCDPKNLRRIYGRRISANDVWMGEKPDYTPIVSGSDGRTNRDRKEYERKRSEKRRLAREANRATTTS
jgi:hypothetical protein